MPSSFPGFPPEALKFLTTLKRNNDREWFQPRKEKFEQFVRKPMIELAAVINEHLRKFAPDYVADPAKALFRIYRDTRFSNDKTPYKTHVSAVFSHRAFPRNYGAGFYLELSPESVGVGGGIYRPGPELLKTLRNFICAEPAAVHKVIRKKSITDLFGDMKTDSLSRVPRGFDPAHEAADLLKARSLFFYVDLPAERALTQAIGTDIAAYFRVLAPFIQLLDRPLLGRKSFRLEDES